MQRLPGRRCAQFACWACTESSDGEVHSDHGEISFCDVIDGETKDRQVDGVVWDISATSHVRWPSVDLRPEIASRVPALHPRKPASLSQPPPRHARLSVTAAPPRGRPSVTPAPPQSQPRQYHYTCHIATPGPPLPAHRHSRSKNTQPPSANPQHRDQHDAPHSVPQARVQVAFLMSSVIENGYLVSDRVLPIP